MYREVINGLRGRQAKILGHEEYFESAVILPLIEKDGQLCVLFELRAHHLVHQPGEISFPGGKIEKEDRGPAQAAIRETCEELGLRAEDIEIICPLDIMVSPFNTIVYPFLALLKNCQLVQPSPDEVEEVFYVPLNFFLDHDPLYKPIWLTVSAPDDFPFDMIPQGRNYPFRKGYYPQFFYLWKDRVIWGLTARILTHFLRLLKESAPVIKF